MFVEFCETSIPCIALHSHDLSSKKGEVNLPQFPFFYCASGGQALYTLKSPQHLIEWGSHLEFMPSNIPRLISMKL